MFNIVSNKKIWKIWVEGGGEKKKEKNKLGEIGGNR